MPLGAKTLSMKRRRLLSGALIWIAALGAVACSSSHEGRRDAAVDVVYTPVDHNADTMYPEAGPPGPLGTPLPAGSEGQWS